MERNSQRVRGFYQASRSWYFTAAHPDGREEFMVGVYHVRPADGCAFEFAIRWHDIGYWRLEAFSDSWSAIPSEFGDLLKMLGDLPSKGATSEQIRNGLVALGIEDLTQTKAPDSVAARELKARHESEIAKMESAHVAELRALKE